MRAVLLLLLAGLAAPALAADEQGVSLADFQAEARARMMQADADHDGKLSAAEWATAAAAMRGGAQGGGGGRDPGRMFKWLDSNGDGYLDAAEIDAMSARRFARMDANGDGKLTAAEREASRAERRGRMGWGGGGGGFGGRWGSDDTGSSQSGGTEQPGD